MDGFNINKESNNQEYIIDSNTDFYGTEENASRKITLQLLAASPRHDTRRPPKVPPPIRPSSRVNKHDEIRADSRTESKSEIRSHSRTGSRPNTALGMKSRATSSKTSGVYSGISSATPMEKQASEKPVDSRATTATRPSTVKSDLGNRSRSSATDIGKDSGIFSNAASRQQQRSRGSQRSTVNVNSRLEITSNLSDSLLSLIEAAERGDKERLNELVSQSQSTSSSRAAYDDNEMKRRLGQLRTPLHRAAGYGQLPAIPLLVKAGANVDAKSDLAGRTALHEACIGGHSHVVRYLCSVVSGCDVIDGQGQTPAHLAAFHGEWECLEELAKARALLGMRDSQGKTPAHLAASRDHCRVLSTLASFNCDLDSPDESGRTPAHYAAQSGAFECLNFLISQDVNIREVDNIGQQPVHLAAAHNRLQCLRGLIRKAKCEWDCRDKRGRTTAHLAAVHGAADCLHWLLENIGDPNITDTEGNTVTHLAAAFGKGECFNCCLQHGGSLELKNNQNETAFDCAKRKGHPVSIQKALTNKVKCVHCVAKHQHFMWQISHPEPEASRNIQSVSRVAYRPVMPSQQFIEHEGFTRQPTSEVELNKIRGEKKKLDFMPKSDIVAQFYGKI